jgi:histidyl-tRNA synthetase
MGAIQAIRGTRDILPSEIGYWQQVEAIASEILNRALYQEIRTPIFEDTALFKRGIGEATDVHLQRSRRSLPNLAPRRNGGGGAVIY